MVYDLPSANVTSFSSMLIYLNNVSAGYFGLLSLFSLFIIAFSSMRKYPMVTNLMASCFVCFVVSILFWLIGLIKLGFVVMWVFALGFLILFKWGEVSG